MTDRVTTIHDPHRRADAPPLTRLVAVIDIGSSSIRMAIGEIVSDGSIRLLESLSRDVDLGRDTFTRGRIRRGTTEDCVAVLHSYGRLVAEYGITNPNQVRVVATSAVREATNRLSFLDRVYVATGLEIEPIDEAEVNRITYLGVQPMIESHPSLGDVQSIVTEVGGGNTEILLVQAGDVIHSNTYQLGSQRLRESLTRAPRGSLVELMRSEVRRTMDQVRRNVPWKAPVEVVALGGDIRFAAQQLVPDWSRDELVCLKVEGIAGLCDEILELSTDDIVRRFQVSYPDANVVGPALLCYLELARTFDRDQLFVCNVNLRDGLLREMASEDGWSDDFARQVTRSAVDLGRKYQFDESHALHVAGLSKQLFKQLAEEHQLEPRFGMLLHTAALLHEIGRFVSGRSLHKHSMYLIQQSALFGLTQTDMLLVALVARYHRGASPKPSHLGYAKLDRDQRIAVTKLAALLRVATALDSSRSGRVSDFNCKKSDNRLVITIPGIEDLSIEQLTLNRNGLLFQQIFGKSVLLRGASLSESDR